MLSYGSHDRNARLLNDLRKLWGTQDYGQIHNFFEVEPDWRCPCCLRNKREISRLDRNGDLFCSLHLHHDHWSECVGTNVRKACVDASAANALERSLTRFEATLICNDCNVVESTVAKRIVEAPPQFSFAPHEIATFIVVATHVPHEVTPELVVKTYEAAKPSMSVLAERIRAINKGIDQENLAPFQQLGQPAFRIMNELRRQMKEGDK